MNIHEQEKVEDGKSISKIRKDNELKIAGFPAVAEDIDAVDEVLTEIDLRTPSQSSVNTGITIDKETAKMLLVSEIFKNGQLAGSYFMKMGDMTNYNKVNYIFWKLKKMKPAEIKIAGVNMANICTEFLSVLLPYKITALSIAKITEANTAYEPLSNEPKEKRIENKINTKSIHELIKQLTEIINLRLRGSLIAMKDSDPDLYYLLYNLTFNDKIGAHSHYPPTVVTGNLVAKVTNNSTGEPIEGVSLRAVGFPQVILTDNFGLAIFELPLGAQVVKFLGFDLQPLELNVEIVAGDVHADVIMTMIA